MPRETITPVVHGQRRSKARWLFGINALVAWCGVILSFTLNVIGYYPPSQGQPTILGENPEGTAGAVGRLFDWFTYFTILSNVLVAVVVTLLFLRPTRDSPIFRILRLDALIMVIVTGFVYNLLLGAGVTHQGWDIPSNLMQHNLTPIVTVLVWLIVGPRGWINIRVISLSLILPLGWAAFALIRGQVVGAYPYPFLDLATEGWASVLSFIGAILVFAIMLALLLMGVDAIIRRLSPGVSAENG